MSTDVGRRTRRPVRIANCSGFYGDRLSAARQLLDGIHPIDVLTGDWLAELTMSILAKDRARGGGGYAKSFVTQMTEVLATCRVGGIRIVSNAGGIAPQACADRVSEIASDLGVDVTIAVVDGDDFTDRISELVSAGERFDHLDLGVPWNGDPAQVLAANAYLGGHAITAGLQAGADVVITGRVADAAIVTGAAAWWHGWTPDDLDALAGATVAGHAIECGTQVTGGNYAFFTDIDDLTEPGFPIAEIADDGSSVITKQAATGGAVTVGTVTAQLLYEISSPRYIVPDVVARFDTVALEQIGPNRVAVTGVVGEPAPSSAKALLTYPGGYRNAMTLAITGDNRAAKADLAEQALWAQIPLGRSAFAETKVELVGARVDSDSPDDQTYLRVSVADPDRQRVGRSFSAAVVATALGSYPGLYLTGPPTDASEYLVGWPTLIDVKHARPRLRINDRELPVPAPTLTSPARDEPMVAVPPALNDCSDRALVKLGSVLGARSGDKGGNANLGLWVSNQRLFAWLAQLSSPSSIAELLPETRGLEIRSYLLPNLLAANVVILGLLGRGVAASLREDPQAKSLGERFRAIRVLIPADLLVPRVTSLKEA